MRNIFFYDLKNNNNNIHTFFEKLQMHFKMDEHKVLILQINFTFYQMSISTQLLKVFILFHQSLCKKLHSFHELIKLKLFFHIHSHILKHLEEGKSHQL